MTRAELEALSRDELIAKARERAVVRPEVLTRAELVDEVLRRADAEPRTRARSRGFLGRARDLIATVIERGLHLPDAAARVRETGSSLPDPPPPLATMTLAEIYAAQGHADRALEVLDEVLAREPEHAAAQALANRLRAEKFPNRSFRAEDAWSDFATPMPERRAPIAPADRLPPPALEAATPELPPPGPGPRPMLDDEPLPVRYDLDEAIVMPVDPTTAYVYWEVRRATIEQTARQRGPGRWIVRLFATFADEAGEHTTIRDVVSDDLVGDYFVFGLPEGADLRATVGWASAHGFEPLVVGAMYTAPPGAPATRVADTLVRWTPALSELVPPPLPAAVAIAVAVEQAQTPIQVTRPRVRREVAIVTASTPDAPAPQIVHVAPGVTRRVTWHRVPDALGGSERWAPVFGDEEGPIGSSASSWG